MVPPKNLPQKIPAARGIRLPEAAVPAFAVRCGGFFLKLSLAIRRIPGGGSACTELMFFAHGRRCLERFRVTLCNPPPRRQMLWVRCVASDVGSEQLRPLQSRDARSTRFPTRTG